ncbi:hypothetical protein BAE44_0016854 [Dichanthelium oligosanthes]|uniref:Uncharacterized protein n=1 Tax=Dichanthelium oligosanthes TaxID=888268 RepID=A0A1E5VAE8_9POAL|nr:hypothetical protein BAE44_0016854 [Dichanthelium oligosanthes]
MAEPAKNDAHIVEIPVSVDGGEAETAAFLDKAPAAAAEAEADGTHPLGEIAASAGHLLLLKLWQREEDRLGRRACALEARMDAARRDAFYLCAAFLAFHGLSLALLFAASVASAASSAGGGGQTSNAACRRWWAPSSLSLAASLALAAAVQLRELRMKGAAFDLSKEPQYGVTRAKCASVEGAGAWAPLRWCQQNVITACLLAVAAAALPSGKFILCA